VTKSHQLAPMIGTTGFVAHYRIRSMPADLKAGSIGVDAHQP
jgi:hypothetical protein